MGKGISISPPAAPPWMTPAHSEWLIEAQDWAQARLGARRIETSVLKRRPWSFVMQVRGAGRTVYFKACAQPGRHEAALLPRLAEAFPDRVPAPLAVDARRAWLLLPDCGDALQAAPQGQTAAWLEVLPRYAEIQRWAAGRRAEWAALGMPDRQPAGLPEKLRRLLADKDSIGLGQPEGISRAERRNMLAELPRFEAACLSLTHGPIPPSLDHGDLHKGNLLIRDGRFWLLDWGDASLAHPFCSLVVTLDTLGAGILGPGSRHLIEAYLGPWELLAERPVLEKLFSTAMWAGHICRALNFRHMLALADEEYWRKFGPHIALWLRKWHANRGLHS